MVLKNILACKNSSKPLLCGDLLGLHSLVEDEEGLKHPADDANHKVPGEHSIFPFLEKPIIKVSVEHSKFSFMEVVINKVFVEHSTFPYLEDAIDKVSVEHSKFPFLEKVINSVSVEHSVFPFGEDKNQ